MQETKTKQCESSSWIISLSCVRSRHLSLSGLEEFFLLDCYQKSFQKFEQPTYIPNSQLNISDVHISKHLQKFTDDRYCEVKQRSFDIRPSIRVGGILVRAWEQIID